MSGDIINFISWQGVKSKKTNLREGEIESSISGLSLSKKFKKEFKDLKAHEILSFTEKHDLMLKNIDEFKDNYLWQ